MNWVLLREGMLHCRLLILLSYDIESCSQCSSQVCRSVRCLGMF